MACERGDVLRGIAPVSGGGPYVWRDGSCAGQVAAWIAPAENDDIVDFSMGEGSRDFWGEANSCDLTASTPSTPTECVDISACDAAYPVRRCVFQDGHNWPTFAPEGMWEFFKSLQ